MSVAGSTMCKRNCRRVDRIDPVGVTGRNQGHIVPGSVMPPQSMPTVVLGRYLPKTGRSRLMLLRDQSGMQRAPGSQGLAWLRQRSPSDYREA